MAPILIALAILLFPVSSYGEDMIIGVIDTGYSDIPGIKPAKLCKTGHADYSGDAPVLGPVPKDTHDGMHGTVIAHNISDTLLKAGVTDFCLVIVKYGWGSAKNANVIQSQLGVLQHMLTIKDIVAINYSSAGTLRLKQEKALFKKILDKGIRVFAAAGNEGLDMDENPVYPAMYDPRITVVSFVNHDGELCQANYGSPVDEMEKATFDFNGRTYCGTSMSTAYATVRFVKNKSKSKK